MQERARRLTQRPGVGGGFDDMGAGPVPEPLRLADTYDTAKPAGPAARPAVGPPAAVKEAAPAAGPPAKPKSSLHRQFGRLGGAVSGKGKR